MSKPFFKKVLLKFLNNVLAIRDDKLVVENERELQYNEIITLL